MGKLSAALGLSDMGGDEPPVEDDMGEAPLSESTEKKSDTGSAELMAMKMFEKATSPEAKVTALKAFLEACGAIGTDY